jgi:hypothetical protein
MRLSHPHTLSTLQIPPAQPAVTASTDQQIPTGNPAQRRDHPRMPFKGMHWLSTVRIPHEEFSALSPAATRGQPPPIGAPGHTHHDSLMSHQLLLQRASGRLSQRDGAVITPAGEERAIRAPGYAPEPGRVRTICPAQGAG